MWRGCSSWVFQSSPRVILEWVIVINLLRISRNQRIPRYIIKLTRKLIILDRSSIWVIWTLSTMHWIITSRPTRVVETIKNYTVMFENPEWTQLNLVQPISLVLKTFPKIKTRDKRRHLKPPHRWRSTMPKLRIWAHPRAKVSNFSAVRAQIDKENSCMGTQLS